MPRLANIPCIPPTQRKVVRRAKSTVGVERAVLKRSRTESKGDAAVSLGEESLGSRRPTPMKARRARRPTNQNDHRQLPSCETYAPTGTPSTVAEPNEAMIVPM